jgi:serine/threonine-protein kinase
MLAPGTEVGRYVVRRKLAEGGMAEIFVARVIGPEGFSKDVVIKVVHGFLSRDQQFVQMFIDEARLASKLNHANVVQIFDFGKHGDSYYLAMEYVRGISLWDLRKRCRDEGIPFPPTLAAEICAQVARGLQYAHSLTEGGQKMGVVHRDVTPHNVLLSFDGAVKLTDFGIAKATSSQTAPGMLKGKFAYMSPEQSRGEKVDARTDVFALGIVLWEMLTGGRLFSGDSDLAVLRAVQESLIAPPSRINPDVPAELSDIVMKALSRAPEERFQTAFEFERALANHVLRSAKSVEETSVALFLQQVWKEQAEPPSLETDLPSDATLEEDDGVGLGRTVARGGKTQTATPAPRAAPEKTLTTPAGPQPLPRLNDDDDDDPSVPTEDHRPLRAKVKTEQMPAAKPSRKLPPLQVAEPSVVLRDSVKTLPQGARQHEPEQGVGRVSVDRSSLSTEQLGPPPTRSKTPMLAIGVMALVVVGLGIGVAVTPKNEPAPVVVAETPPVDPPPTPSAEPKVEEKAPPALAVDDVPVAPTPVEPKVAAVPASKPEPVKVVAPVVKKGFILVKAVPFATVTIQGRSYEVTGVKTLPAPAGTYEISLAHPKRKVKENVTVTPNGTTNVTFSAE